MFKTFAIVLLASLTFAGTAAAMGAAGGGGMGSNGTNYGQSTLGNDVQHSAKPTHHATKAIKHKRKHVQKQ
jgi:ABC-type methionine transport system permease subunit